MRKVKIIKHAVYINPWYDGFNIPKQMYSYKDVPCYDSPCGKGQILHVMPSQYDYLINGRVVTQRGGRDMDYLGRIINFLTNDGPEFMHSGRIQEAYEKGAAL